MLLLNILSSLSFFDLLYKRIRRQLAGEKWAQTITGITQYLSINNKCQFSTCFLLPCQFLNGYLIELDASTLLSLEKMFTNSIFYIQFITILPSPPQVKEKKTHQQVPKPPFLDFSPLRSSTVRMLCIVSGFAAFGCYSPIFYLVRKSECSRRLQERFIQIYFFSFSLARISPVILWWKWWLWYARFSAPPNFHGPLARRRRRAQRLNDQ